MRPGSCQPPDAHHCVLRLRGPVTARPRIVLRRACSLSSRRFVEYTGNRRAGSDVSRAPNILLITSDEERFNIPRPSGLSLPARDRIAESGVTFERYYAASTQCSSSRSVIYTGRHLPITQIYDNDNMPYVRPLDPALGTLGTMLRAQGYYCTYQGKWHLSNAYVDPAQPVPPSTCR